MVLDDALLAIAKAKQSDVTEAERKAEMAKADFHDAVRRLHLAGASLREVADAIGISHQRVQQIVQAGGGSWWSRVWRGRDVRPDMTCSFCGSPPGAIAKLLAGPHVYVCDACVERAERALREGPVPGSAIGPIAPSSRVACSFCARRPSLALRLAGTHEHRVCEECLGICRSILDGRAAAAP